ncbi:mitochondrial enolase superfamily member 1 [Grus japonensis]|uniref:Mitochondrial enolase superfamily member 1 n=1 Tax=Grus japonensis TaxID=30415 RepID=A0ABC9Y416_GRUJA
MEVHGGADMHSKEAVTPWRACSGAGCWQDQWTCGERSPHWSRFAGRTCDPMGDPHWSSLLLKVCTPWKGPTLEQLVKNCSPWEGLTLEKFMEDCLLWEGPHTGAREEGEAETMCDELTATPIPCPPVRLEGHSPGETGKTQIGWVVCEMGRKLSRSLHSEGGDQRVYSVWQSVTSEVSQGSVLGPTLFNIFINDLDDGTERTLTKFADVTKLAGEVDILQRDRLEEWASKNCMKFNKDTCEVLHLEQHKQRAQHRQNDLCGWGAALLGVTVDNELNMSQQSAAAPTKANGILSYILRGIISRNRDVTILLFLAFVRLHPEYCVQF